MIPTRWRILPRIRLVNYRKIYPEAQCWDKLSFFRVQRYWGDRLIYLSFGARSLIFDFRRNWLADMVSREE